MKMCKQCGSEFTKRRSEAYWQYEKRLFCSRPCADVGRRTTRVPDSAFKARYRQKKLSDGSRMLEHRWVMERHLGRKLAADEQVHHINGNRLDNRVENLEVVTSAEHGMRHTKHPVSKACVICQREFTPSKTKRARAKTCGPACLHVLRKQLMAARKRSVA